MKKITYANVLLLATCMQNAFAYELPPMEQRHIAYAENMTLHNALLLRDKTRTSIVATLIKNGQGYELKDNLGNKNTTLQMDVDPSIKISDTLIGQKVKATGLMTYKTMYFPDADVSKGPAYSFKFELYAIEKAE
jgi:hypothetical protein